MIVDFTESSISNLATQLGDSLKASGWLCTVAESCTGGRVAASITDIAGSSQWFDRGFITYSNQAKIEMLNVPVSILTAEGAVSEEVVCAMAKGSLLASQADLSVAVSGIAGPSGGSIEKPVGLVWFAWAKREGDVEAESYYFKGSRFAVRMQAVYIALDGLIQRCKP